MAFTLVQTATQTTGTGSTLACTLSATAAGNIVAMHIRMSTNAETCTSVTDDKGNTYSLSNVLDDGVSLRVYQAEGVQLTSGTTTVTANFSSNVVFKRCGATEYHNDAGTWPSSAAAIGSSTTGIGTGANEAVSTLTTAAAGSLIVASSVTATSQTRTAGTNYVNGSGAGASLTLGEIYRLSSDVTETAPLTTGGAPVWAELAREILAPSSRRNRMALLGVS